MTTGQLGAAPVTGLICEKTSPSRSRHTPIPSWVIGPIWDQFAALYPAAIGTHPSGCYHPYIADRVVFDKRAHLMVFGVAYAKIADTTCSATTIRTRHDKWTTAGIFHDLETGMSGDVRPDRPAGPREHHRPRVPVLAQCGGQAARLPRSTAANKGTKRSLMTDPHQVRGRLGEPERPPLLRPLQNAWPVRPGYGHRPARPCHRAPGRRRRLRQDP